VLPSTAVGGAVKIIVVYVIVIVVIKTAFLLNRPLHWSALKNSRNNFSMVIMFALLPP